MKEKKRLLSTAVSAFVGCVLGITIYLVMWLAPYVRDFPWYVAILLDALIPWIVSRFGFAPSPSIIVIPTTVGGVVGLLLTETLNLWKGICRYH